METQNIASSRKPRRNRNYCLLSSFRRDPALKMTASKAFVLLLSLLSTSFANFYPRLGDDFSYESPDYGGDSNGRDDELFQDIVARMADYIDMESLLAQPSAGDPVIPDATLRDTEDIHHAHLFGPSENDGFQYMQGGAGEGVQWLKPEGSILNKQEVKTDKFLPAYCDPPNPCPIGFTSDDGCDPAPGSKFTAEYSKVYQASQECQCDSEHNYGCADGERRDDDVGNLKENLKNLAKMMTEAEKEPKDTKTDANETGHNGSRPPNPYLVGEPLKRVAKKAPIYNM